MAGLGVGRVASRIDLAVQGGNGDEVEIIWAIPSFSTLANSDILSPEESRSRQNSDGPPETWRISLTIKAKKSLMGGWFDVEVFGSLIHRLPTNRKPDSADVQLTYRGSSGEIFRCSTKVASPMINQSFRFATMQIHPDIFCGGTDDFATVTFTMKLPFLMKLPVQAVLPIVKVSFNEHNDSLVELQATDFESVIPPTATTENGQPMAVTSAGLSSLLAVTEENNRTRGLHETHLNSPVAHPINILHGASRTTTDVSSKSSPACVGVISSRLCRLCDNGMKRYVLNWDIGNFFSPFGIDSHLTSPPIDLRDEMNTTENGDIFARWQIMLNSKSEDGASFQVSGSLQSLLPSRKPSRVRYQINYKINAARNRGCSKHASYSTFKDQFEFSRITLNMNELASSDIKFSVILHYPVHKMSTTPTKPLTAMPVTAGVQKPSFVNCLPNSEIGKINSNFAADTQNHVITWSLPLLEDSTIMTSPLVDLLDGESGDLFDRWQIKLLVDSSPSSDNGMKLELSGMSRFVTKVTRKSGQVDLSFEYGNRTQTFFHSVPSVSFGDKFNFETRLTKPVIFKMASARFVITLKYASLLALSVPEPSSLPLIKKVTLENAVAYFIIAQKEKDDRLAEKVIRVVQAGRIEFIKRGGYKEMFKEADEQVSTTFFVLLAKSTSARIVDVNPAVLGKSERIKRVKRDE